MTAEDTARRKQNFQGSANKVRTRLQELGAMGIKLFAEPSHGLSELESMIPGRYSSFSGKAMPLKKEPSGKLKRSKTDWAIASRSEKTVLRNLDDTVTTVAFSAGKARTFAAGTVTGRIYVHSSETGKEIAKHELKAAVSSIRFLPPLKGVNHEIFLTASFKGFVKAFVPKDGECVQYLDVPWGGTEITAMDRSHWLPHNPNQCRVVVAGFGSAHAIVYDLDVYPADKEAEKPLRLELSPYMRLEQFGVSKSVATDALGEIVGALPPPPSFVTAHKSNLTSSSLSLLFCAQ